MLLVLVLRPPAVSVVVAKAGDFVVGFDCWFTLFPLVVVVVVLFEAVVALPTATAPTAGLVGLLLLLEGKLVSF